MPGLLVFWSWEGIYALLITFEVEVNLKRKLDSREALLYEIKQRPRAFEDFMINTDGNS